MILILYPKTIPKLLNQQKNLKNIEKNQLKSNRLSQILKNKLNINKLKQKRRLQNLLKSNKYFS